MSAIQNPPVQFQPPVPLNTDFNHSPTGSLGGRTVRQGTPSFPRAIKAMFQQIGKGFKSLANRIAEIRQPSQVRSDNAFRKGLEKASKQVGELLGALSQSGAHPTDTAAVRRLVDGMENIVQPLLTRGADYSEVFRARLGVNIGKMSVEQLVSLRDGLRAAEQTDLQQDGAIASHLDAIKTAVDDALAERLDTEIAQVLKPVIERACAQVEREAENPGAVGYVFDSLTGAAKDMLARFGFTSDTPDQAADLERALIREAIESMVKFGGPNLEAVGKMVNCLPSRDLHALVHTQATIKPDGAFAADRVLTGAIGLRMETAETGFLDGAGKLLAHREPVADDPTGSLRSPSGFAREVIDTARHLDVIRKHGAIHELQTGEGIDPKLTELQQHLTTLLTANNLSLGQLSPAELHQFGKALETLGVAGPREEIQAEVARRRDAVTAEYNTALGAVIDAAKSGDQTALLRALETLKAKADIAGKLFSQLGQKIDGADGIMAMRQELLVGGLRGMAQDDLLNALGILKNPEFRALSEGMLDLANFFTTPPPDRQENPERARGLKIMNSAIETQLLTDALETVLGEQGVNLPPLPDRTRYNQASLSPASRRAILDVFGVEPGLTTGGDIKAGLASDRVQQTFSGYLQREVSPESRATHRLDTGLSTGVTGPFWRDLGRANYSIQASDGTVTSILDRTGWNKLDTSIQTQRSLGAVHALTQLLDGDTEMVQFVSQYAHQGMLAGLQASILSENSPLHLPNGLAGQMMGPESIAWTFSRDDQGSVVLRGDYSVNGAIRFFDPSSGQMTWLKAESSNAHFSFEVTFTQDRQITVSEPIQFMFDLVEDTSWKQDYPRPTNMADILTGSLNLKTEFRAYAEERLITENLDFLEAHRAFVREPTLEGARALMNRFVGEESEFNVNFDDEPTVRRIRDTLNGINADTLTPDELVDLFESAAENITNMMQPVVIAFQHLKAGEA